MSQEVEIEVKSMVDKNGYLTLLQAFGLNQKDAICQHNHYFESNNFSLKEKGAGLRIREKDGQYTLTLKQPHTIGKLETHQTLTVDEWLTAKKKHIIPVGAVQDQLNSLQIPINELRYVGTLTTHRIEINYNSGLLCFDRSEYFDQSDYEIEFEGKDEQHALQTLTDMLRENGLSLIATENKVRRFFRRKLELNQ
ncbi:CYTH domain-containing protein [Bacillus suaedae]|uniref:CYTH domain-containing protein n=1 Tax=Halalkalibacter suaedae TaxID=2822140 RepID=A0A941AM35_9BACI|nr:CYTH domain-containing protein [Bacillus suaedae]MBP3949511.1 CYTH domain-containing protein [Bacillus suaedae]